MPHEARAYCKMLYFNIHALLILKVFIFEYIVAFPNEHEAQDADAGEKIHLLQLLNGHSKNDSENQHQGGSVNNDSSVSWKWVKGEWVPIQPTGEDSTSESVSYERYSHMQHANGSMEHTGVICDDGKTNLTVDWDHSRTSYTCFRRRIVPDLSLAPEYHNKTIPENYIATHRCMHRSIHYEEEFPTFGVHRPAWPVYGEYKYVPTQRWLHSLEHGAVVALYHPCASTHEIKKLEKLVKGCLRRHIIARNNRLNETRPFALLTWGHKMMMSHIDEDLVKQFIQDTALRGPEDISDDGDFNDQLIKKASHGLDEDDDSFESEGIVSMLCSKLK